MQVRKGTPPPTVERDIAVDLTREEVLAIIVAHVKSKLGPTVRFDDIQVAADELDKLTSVSISGKETITLAWKPSEPTQPTPPAVPAASPFAK